MVSEVRALPPLVIPGEQDAAAAAWKLWLQRFKLFLSANGYDSEDAKEDKQVAMFLHLIGEHCLVIFNSFGLNNKLENKSLKLNDVIEKFNDHFVPKKNLTYVRHKFFTRSQEESESIENYVAALNKMSYECEFDKLRKDLVKDILVVGIKNIQLKERLLREDNLDLDKAVSICKTAEITSERIKTLDSAAKSLKEEPVYHVQKFNNVVQSRNVSPRKNNRVISCFRCGESGHYANRCRRGRQHNRRVVNLCTREPVSESHYQDENTQDEGSQYFVGVVGKSYSKPCDWFETVIINDIHFKSKIDTGPSGEYHASKTISSAEIVL
ncbi:hypothetical protein WDU94_005685 [Cyamophila willieti]